MVSYLKLGSLVCFLASTLCLAYYFDLGNSTQNQYESVEEKGPSISYFIDLVITQDQQALDKALTKIDAEWMSESEILLIEALYFTQHRDVSKKLVSLLERKTGKRFGYDFDAWYEWLWNKDATYADDYYEYKAELHQLIDPKFGPYFLNREEQSTIRLDEVRWGGVLQDGIPPLRNPKMISATEATYLKDSNTVFGIEVNGDARAYPKRILAWHEMFVDTVGDVPVAGVYCTLCGTVILYKTEHKGINHAMGTSGFLYRSNKLMYDQETQSLWSTMEGEPVIGPLVGKGIRLSYLSVVTTTWGEWKERHPNTAVLSLNTGHRRDYGEGIAYKDYFATDDLMFNVPEVDKRLRNKDEILSLRAPEETKENIAVSSKFLKKNSVYQLQLGSIPLVIFTDASGAHRVYRSNGITFNTYDKKATATDATGTSWNVAEEELRATDGTVLARFPSHNAFWFGYKAAFPDTQLIK